MDAVGTGEEPIYLVNEYASVRVRKIRTRNGERLEITSLSNGGRTIALDALVLESLTWSTVLEVGQGLQTPFGPEPEDESPAPESAPEEDTR